MTNKPCMFLLALLLVTCPACARKAFDPDLKPSLLQFTDDAATTAGIGLLREAPIEAGSTELRIWTGFGDMMPEDMLRLRIDAAGKVAGEMQRRFVTSGMQRDQRDRLLSEVMRHCKDLRGASGGRKHDVCTATFDSEPDWQALYAHLRKLGVETLPDESTLSKQVDVLDGISMVVEVRKGASYRAYAYGNPSYNDAPQAQKADTILRAVAEIARQSHA